MDDGWEAATIGIDDALAAARRIGQINRLTRCLRGLDPMTAAKKGVAPGELDAINGMRLSELDSRRLDHLAETLLNEPSHR